MAIDFSLLEQDTNPPREVVFVSLDQTDLIWWIGYQSEQADLFTLVTMTTTNPFSSIWYSDKG